YAVFVGRRTGVFTNWRECEEQYSGVSHSSHKGYTSKALAEAAFSAAQARGLTFACGQNQISVSRVAVRARLTESDLPLCLAFMDDPTSLAMMAGERDTERWYVVFRGTQPGVYRTFNEVLLATTGLSGSQHASFHDQKEAVEEFTNALRAGKVEKYI
ncbi:hypothetical protein FB107DRAFT_177414, partial [Schizophyllum commune]